MRKQKLWLTSGKSGKGTRSASSKSSRRRICNQSRSITERWARSICSCKARDKSEHRGTEMLWIKKIAAKDGDKCFCGTYWIESRWSTNFLSTAGTDEYTDSRAKYRVHKITFAKWQQLWGQIFTRVKICTAKDSFCYQSHTGEKYINIIEAREPQSFGNSWKTVKKHVGKLRVKMKPLGPLNYSTKKYTSIGWSKDDLPNPANAFDLSPTVLPFN